MKSLPVAQKGQPTPEPLELAWTEGVYEHNENSSSSHGTGERLLGQTPDRRLTFRLPGGHPKTFL